ncbi:MAG: type II secretion system F family protein [Blautia faecis]
MKLFHFNTRSKKARQKIKEISEIKGKKYAEFYYYIMQGAKITYGYTILIVMILLASVAGSVEALLLGVVLAVLLVLYVDFSLKDKLDARRQEILMDLPQALSKLTLLINSGMVVRDAWKRTAITGTRQLYIEMQQTSLEIENGVMEIEAYRNFAERCGVKEVKKFSTLIIQNLKKGNEELAMFLNDLSDEMWEMKKNEVKQKGEKANSKLLLPVFLIFIGILILVLVPMMNGMG